MALVRWNTDTRPAPTATAARRDDGECYYEDYYGALRPWWVHRATPAFTPRVDVVNHEKEIIVRADVPGVEPDDLDVTITNDVVTIKGERKDDDLARSECFYCRESAVGAFERNVDLPDSVLRDEAKATLKNGVLTLTLPKERPTGPIKIEVS
jgi:HSP20 family protein